MPSTNCTVRARGSRRRELLKMCRRSSPSTREQKAPMPVLGARSSICVQPVSADLTHQKRRITRPSAVLHLLLAQSLLYILLYYDCRLVHYCICSAEKGQCYLNSVQGSFRKHRWHSTLTKCTPTTPLPAFGKLCKGTFEVKLRVCGE